VKATAATYTLVGAGGRRLRVGQWHTGESALHPPLIVLTGIGMNLELFDPVAAAFPERRIIGVEMPGVGATPDPLLPYTMSSMALTLSAVLDELGIAEADVMGMSWGGALAQQFAFQHRHRTRRLALVATSAGATMFPTNLKTLLHLLNPAELTLEKTLKRNLGVLYAGGGSGQRISLNAARPPSAMGWACQLGAFSTWSSLPFLPLLDLPVLVMGDEDDQVVPACNARMLAKAIPGSRLEMFRQGGHLFVLSQRDKFAAKMREFLDYPQD
jgi:pimeloyl-ACP methyl ester carboxylesterase